MYKRGIYMKLKISIIFLLFAMFLNLSACSQSNNDPSNEKITNSPVITESKNKESDVRTFALSDYTYEVEFIDENDILKIKESYDLDNTDSISKIVYVPFITGEFSFCLSCLGKDIRRNTFPSESFPNSTPSIAVNH